MSLKMGSAQIDITPPVGARMAGFAGRDHGAEGIHDPLRAKALALDDGQTRLVIVGMDILSGPYDFVESVAADLRETAGLGEDQVLMNFSHTHSGPVIQQMPGMGSPNSEYRALLGKKLVGLVQMALDEMVPVGVTSHSGPLQIGVNRRERTEDGSTKLGVNPEGIVDTTVEALRFADEDGCTRALWFSHAAHPVTRGGDNYFISADWPGQAQHVLEGVYPGATVAFGQGCCGNINSDPWGGEFEDVRMLGTRAAGAVMAAVESEGSQLTPRLAHGKTSAWLPQQDPPPVEELDDFIKEHRRMQQEAREEGNTSSANVLGAGIKWAEKLREIARDEDAERKMRFDISAVCIGEHAIVGLAGEVFFEYSVNIADRSPFERTSVLGTTNGCAAYIPTAAEIPYGGYEVQASNRYYRQLELKPEAEQIVIDEAGTLLDSLS